MPGVEPPAGYVEDAGFVRDEKTRALLTASSGGGGAVSDEGTHEKLDEVEADLDEVVERLPTALDNGSLNVADTYTTGEALAAQNGAGAVLTFTLTKQEDLIWVLSKGAESFADPFGGVPADKKGIPCLKDTPQPMTVRVAAGGTVKVFAPAGAEVFVWGYGS